MSTLSRFRLAAAPLLTLAALLAPGAASALTLPQKISFQGKLLDPSTNAPKAGPVTLSLSLYSVPSGGTALYTETQSNVPLTNGVFAVQIGTNTALLRELFAGASAYLGVTVSGDPGGEMAPRTQLVMSPYAFTAAQLSDSSDVRLIAGAAYSTFTSAGNLAVPNGVAAGSGTFTGGVTAASGTFTATGAAQYSVAASSGIDMNAGTLSLAGSAGLDASGTGIKAATATLTATGQTQYSLTASSGILVSAGKVDAPVFVGSGAELVNVRPEMSTNSVTTSFSAASGTEVLVSSTQINPSRVDSRFYIWSNVDLSRSANSLATWTIRLRRNIGANCTTASGQVDVSFTHTVPNTAGMTQHVHVDFMDAPATASTVYYCVTVQQASGNAHNVAPRNMGAMEVAPAR